VGSRPTWRRSALLDELCTRFGYCAGLDEAAIDPGASSDDVVEQVLSAEGRDLATVERKEWQDLTGVVNDWLSAPDGRGAKSGLPL
jgi:hypothetical protein